uniref:Uncharacterized protein n=1 Tax=Heterorhabditis bacteriophora TaxID=37862 RepID=A0A1I7X2L0_HETBA
MLICRLKLDMMKYFLRKIIKQRQLMTTVSFVFSVFFELYSFITTKLFILFSLQLFLYFVEIHFGHKNEFNVSTLFNCQAFVTLNFLLLNQPSSVPSSRKYD